MIHESKHEFCVIAEYTNGDSFCMAKFMHEEDARKYKRSRKKEEFVTWKLYERRESSGSVMWKEL